MTSGEVVADRRDELVRRWFELLTERRFDELGDLLTEDAVMDLVHFDHEAVNRHTTVKYENPLKGRDAIVRLYTKSAEIFDRLSFEVDAVHLVEGGGIAVVEYRSDGIATPTKRPYRNTYAAVFEFRGDRISLWREYHDPAAYSLAFDQT